MSGACVAAVVVTCILPGLATAAPPAISIDLTPTTITGDSTTDVTATIDNTSGDFDLTDASASLDLPSGTSLVSGDDNPFVSPLVAVGNVETAVWTVKNLTPGDKEFSVTVEGLTDGDPFSSSDSAQLSVSGANPTPEVTLEISPTYIGGTIQAQVTATVDNASSDFDLDSLSVELSLPGGVNLPSGDTTVDLGALARDGSTNTTWVVQGGYSGTKNLSATATGTLDGDEFSDTDSKTLDVDMDPPTVSVPAQPLWSTTAAPSFQWSGNDALSAVDFYDVEFAIDNGDFVHLLTAQDPGSTTIVAQEGQKVRVRVSATDLFGNVSGWTEVSTTIDAIGPVASFGTVDSSKQGIRSIPLFYSNVGSPVTAKFTFANKNGGRTGNALNGEVVSYTNNESKPDFAQLTLVATDALGRRATAQDTYLIEPRLGSSGLKFKGIRRSGKSFVIKGLISKSFTGKVSVVATRIGSKGSKRVATKAKVKKGVFTAKLRLKAGRYKFTATSPKTTKFSETTISSKLTIR